MQDIIFGKNETKNIVSCEIRDDLIHVFTEDHSGIKLYIKPHQFWVLAKDKLDNNFTRLDGDLWYKYIRLFNTKEEQEDFIEDNKFRKDIYFCYDDKEAAMIAYGFTYFKDLKVPDVSVLSFDIETTGLDPQASDAKVLLIANTYRKNDIIIRKMFSYNDYSSQKELIEDWCKWVRKVNPSVIVGHNIVIYDLPYLNSIAEQHNTNLQLGRDDSNLSFNEKESKFRKDASQKYTYRKPSIFGREVIDTFFLSIKYDVQRKYESYKLKQIIKQEGLEVKDRQFYNADEIRYKYNIPEEWEKIKKYAEHDGDDALALYDLMVSSFFYLCQMFPRSFQNIIESASGSQINSFLIRSYLQNFHSIPKSSPGKDFEGAISLGNPGVYKNVLKVDVASLYPSIILTYNVCDTYKDPKKHFLITARYLTEQRLQNKQLAKDTGDRHYRDLEQAQKIIINSFYGFLGAKGLNFNSPFNAGFITEKGRDILQKSISWATDKKFSIVNADTDSISFSKEHQDEYTKEEQEALIKELNSLYPDTIHWEHDGIFKTVLVVKAKNYVLQDLNGKVKIKGSALKASMKEPALKEFIKEVINELLEGNKDNVLALYNKYILEILNLSDVTRWSSKKTVTDKVLNPERTNEQKVLDAMDEEEEEFQEGDKIFVYFTVDGKLKLQENWKNDHCPFKLIEKLWKTVMIFETVLNKEQFVKYHLKGKRKFLEQVNVKEIY